jgi:hypothetical protein
MRGPDAERSLDGIERPVGPCDSDREHIGQTQIGFLEHEHTRAELHGIAIVPGIAGRGARPTRERRRRRHRAGERVHRDAGIGRNLTAVGGHCSTPVDVPATSAVGFVVPEFGQRARRTTGHVRIDQPRATVR